MSLSLEEETWKIKRCGGAGRKQEKNKHAIKQKESDGEKKRSNIFMRGLESACPAEHLVNTLHRAVACVTEKVQTAGTPLSLSLTHTHTHTNTQARHSEIEKSKSSQTACHGTLGVRGRQTWKNIQVAQHKNKPVTVGGVNDTHLK